MVPFLKPYHISVTFYYTEMLNKYLLANFYAYPSLEPSIYSSLLPSSRNIDTKKQHIYDH